MVMRCWLLQGGSSLESMTVLGVTPLALWGSAQVLMVLTSSSMVKRRANISAHSAQGRLERAPACHRDAISTENYALHEHVAPRDPQRLSGLTPPPHGSGVSSGAAVREQQQQQSHSARPCAPKPSQRDQTPKPSHQPLPLLLPSTSAQLLSRAVAS